MRDWHRLAGELAKLTSEIETASPAQRFGAGVIGPVIASFVHAAGVVACGSDRICFMAREGLVLKEAYDVLRPLFGPAAPTSVYLPVSRISTLRPAMAPSGVYGHREIPLIASNGGDFTARKLFAPLCGEHFTLAEILGSSNIDPDEIMGPGDRRLAARLADPVFMSMVRDVRERSLSGFHAAMKRCGITDASRLALVDAGWAGQIQENIEIALAACMTPAPELAGIYIGVNGTGAARRRTGAGMIGILCDAGSPNWLSFAAFSFVQGLENMLRASHGSILDYAEDGRPRLAGDDRPSRIAEIATEPLVSEIQRSALDFVRVYASAAAEKRFSLERGIAMARLALARMVYLPRYEEVSVFAGFGNASNMGTEEITSLVGTKRETWRKRRDSIRQSLWRPGAARLQYGQIGSFAWASRELANIPAAGEGFPRSFAWSSPPGRSEPVSPRFDFEIAARDSMMMSSSSASSFSFPAPCPPPVVHKEILGLGALAAVQRVVRVVRRRPDLPGPHPLEFW